MNLLTDEKELAEIEALCEAATPEPWVIGIQIAARSWPVFSLRDMETATEDEARRDAALIERCRTDLPRAVATIRVLKPRLERLEHSIGTIGSPNWSADVNANVLELWASRLEENQGFEDKLTVWLRQLAQEFRKKETPCPSK